MYTGSAAIQQYVDGGQGRLVIKKNELHFDQKIGFALRFKAKFFGSGHASMKKIAAYVDQNRHEVFTTGSLGSALLLRTSFIQKLDDYNQHRTFSFKKTLSIQPFDLTYTGRKESEGTTQITHHSSSSSHKRDFDRDTIPEPTEKPVFAISKADFAAARQGLRHRDSKVVEANRYRPQVDFGTLMAELKAPIALKNVQEDPREASKKRFEEAETLTTGIVLRAQEAVNAAVCALEEAAPSEVEAATEEYNRALKAYHDAIEANPPQCLKQKIIKRFDEVKENLAKFEEITKNDDLSFEQKWDE